MKLSNIKTALQSAEGVTFQLPGGASVPAHFHVTEVGITTKHFIDCGGTVRTEQKANFQLWKADDTDHRLEPQKLLRIISLSEKTLGLDVNLDVEVEYQHADTIGKYGLSFDGQHFQLLNTKTACLASDACGIPEAKTQKNLPDLQLQAVSCTPGGGCC